MEWSQRGLASKIREADGFVFVMGALRDGMLVISSTIAVGPIGQTIAVDGAPNSSQSRPGLSIIGRLIALALISSTASPRGGGTLVSLAT